MYHLILLELFKRIKLKYPTVSKNKNIFTKARIKLNINRRQMWYKGKL